MINPEALASNIRFELAASKEHGEDCFCCTYGLAELMLEYIEQTKSHNSKKIVRHIPTQCCYYTEEDGETVIICGCNLCPELDGIFWEETNEYIEKKPEWVEARRKG